MNQFFPDYRVPPGETILELMKHKNMDVKDLATKLHKTEEEIEKLLKGELPLTLEMAQKLEELFQVSTAFWLNLQRLYNEELKDKRGV